MPYKLNGKVLQLDRAFTDSTGVQRPANWLRLSTERDRELLGITWEAPTDVSYDQRCYWGPSNPKQLNDEPAVDLKLFDNAPIRRSQQAGSNLVLLSLPQCLQAGLNFTSVVAILIKDRLVVELLRDQIVVGVIAPIEPLIPNLICLSNPCDAKQLAVTLSAQPQPVGWTLDAICIGPGNV